MPPIASAVPTFEGVAEEAPNLAVSLFDGGPVRTPLGDHGFSRRCTWIAGRCGVAWRRDLP